MSDLLGLWQARILPPDDPGSYLDLALRWTHIVAGIAWLGLLYYFNLVQVPALPRLESARGPYLAHVLTRALRWFRWSALATFLAGFYYWHLNFRRDLDAAGGDTFTFALALFDWTVVVLLAWVAVYLSLRVPAVAKNGALFGLLFALLMVWLGYQAGWKSIPPVSNRVTSISIGGAYGTVLLLNVWGIVWPAQKRLLGWVKTNPGTSPPDELNAALRRALLVSRASFWLTFPMLFLMAAASHFPLFARE